MRPMRLARYQLCFFRQDPAFQALFLTFSLWRIPDRGGYTF